MKFVIAPGKDKKYYWSLIARNGKTIADGSEGYASAGNCRKAVNRIISAMSRRTSLGRTAVKIETVR